MIRYISLTQTSSCHNLTWLVHKWSALLLIYQLQSTSMQTSYAPGFLLSNDIENPNLQIAMDKSVASHSSNMRLQTGGYPATVLQSGIHCLTICAIKLLGQTSFDRLWKPTCLSVVRCFLRIRAIQMYIYLLSTYFACHTRPETSSNEQK